MAFPRLLDVFSPFPINLSSLMGNVEIRARYGLFQPHSAEPTLFLNDDGVYYHSLPLIVQLQIIFRRLE